ncbi:hypothetical protein N0V95_009784, partial [Ascochyta clinopodiicola]
MVGCGSGQCSGQPTSSAHSSTNLSDSSCASTDSNRSPQAAWHDAESFLRIAPSGSHPKWLWLLAQLSSGDAAMQNHPDRDTVPISQPFAARGR